MLKNSLAKIQNQDRKYVNKAVIPYIDKIQRAIQEMINVIELVEK